MYVTITDVQANVNSTAGDSDSGWMVLKPNLSSNPYFFFSSRRRHTRSLRDWSSDVCSSDLGSTPPASPCLRLPLLVSGDGAPEWRQAPRSEERRVGKECRSRWSQDHKKK